MSLLILLVLIGGPLLLVVIAVATRAQTQGRVDTSQEWKSVRMTWAAALVIGVLSAWLVNSAFDLGRGTMLVPAVLGLFVVAGVGLGETVVQPPRSTGPRTASLAPRRAADYLPRALTTAVALITTLHLATLALSTATASTDDMGRVGRQIGAQCGNRSSAAGPYPGSFYSIPLVVLLVLIGMTAAAALMVIAHRPRGFAPDNVGDDILRRQSTTRVLAAAGAALAASHVGIAFFAGTALLRMDCQRTWMEPIGWLLVASVPAALLLCGWFMGRLLAPRRVAASAQAVGTR